jgi:hypothetical protein
MEIGERPISGIKMLLAGDSFIDLYVSNVKSRDIISFVTEIFLKSVTFSATC